MRSWALAASFLILAVGWAGCLDVEGAEFVVPWPRVGDKATYVLEGRCAGCGTASASPTETFEVTGTFDLDLGGGHHVAAAKVLHGRSGTIPSSQTLLVALASGLVAATCWDGPCSQWTVLRAPLSWAFESSVFHGRQVNGFDDLLGFDGRIVARPEALEGGVLQFRTYPTGATVEVAPDVPFVKHYQYAAVGGGLAGARLESFVPGTGAQLPWSETAPWKLPQCQPRSGPVSQGLPPGGLGSYAGLGATGQEFIDQARAKIPGLAGELDAGKPLLRFDLRRSSDDNAAVGAVVASLITSASGGYHVTRQQVVGGVVAPQYTVEQDPGSTAPALRTFGVQDGLVSVDDTLRGGGGDRAALERVRFELVATDPSGNYGNATYSFQSSVGVFRSDAATGCVIERVATGRF